MDQQFEFPLVLSAIVWCFTAFPWWPIFKGKLLSLPSLAPLLLLSLSSLLQVLFLVLLGTGSLLLDSSLKFAAPGLPLSIAALVLAARKKRPRDLPRGTLACTIVGVVLWFFLITAH